MIKVPVAVSAILGTLLRKLLSGDDFITGITTKTSIISGCRWKKLLRKLVSQRSLLMTTWHNCGLVGSSDMTSTRIKKRKLVICDIS
jgi:hypothetical protein